MYLRVYRALLSEKPDQVLRTQADGVSTVAGNLSDFTSDSSYLSQSDKDCFNAVCGDLLPMRCFTVQLRAYLRCGV